MSDIHGCYSTLISHSVSRKPKDQWLDLINVLNSKNKGLDSPGVLQ